VKGKSTFTEQEVADLRRLIAEKQTADRDRQKALRGKMRSIGFYITDFDADQRGFTASDLDDLIARGTIVVNANREARSPSRSAADGKATVRREPAGYSTEDRDRARSRRERAAREYMPKKVDLLLVAEAPPSTLDRYFYFPDVREQDSLFRYVCRALLGRDPTRDGKANLLAELRDRGILLIDLQEEPRDGTPLVALAPELVERCKSLDPEWIVLIKTTVFDAAHDTLEKAGLPVSSVRIPFPGSGQQKRFLEAFDRALKERSKASSA
jgi:hypothetical protein